MDIHDINPFLRFVNKIQFKPIKRSCRAVDCHFYYAHEDYCTMYIGGERYEIKRGTIAIVPAGVDYYFDYDGIFRIVSINFDYTQAHRHLDETHSPLTADIFDDATVIERPDFTDYPFLNKPIVLDNMSYLSPTVDAILKEYTYKKQFYAETASSDFRKIIFELIRNLLCERTNSESVNFILEYIHEHYAEPLTNAALSQLVGYHPYHLNRLMKSSTGTTLHQYLISYRIETAKRYLRETDYSISYIAEHCGYPDLCNFSGDFKSKTGMSPLKYRAALGNMV